MSKRKRKLTAAEKAAKKRRRKEYMIIFIRGKQKRVRRPPTINGLDAEEFILRNAGPDWLHQNELWEYIQPHEPASSLSEQRASEQGREEATSISHRNAWSDDDDIPF